MTTKTLGLAIVLSFFTTIASSAQENLFLPAPEAPMLDAQQGMLEELRKEPTTADIQVITINADILKAPSEEAPARSINLNFSSDKIFSAVPTKIDQRDDNEFTWHGDVPGKPSSVTLVVKGGNVTGSATIANELYAIEPLGSGLHAVIRKDLGKFPPEHPPSFEKLEPSKESLQDRMEIPGGGDSGQIIRVLVAYTDAVENAHIDPASFVQLAVDEANTSYQNSQVVPRLELAHSYKLNYTESGDYDTDIARLRGNDDGFMDEVHALRDAHLADVVLLIFDNSAACGLASDIMAKAVTAFAVVHHACATGYYSFAHEIGHLQGARHNPGADPSDSPFRYGHGYYNAGAHWRTVMSYNCPGGCTRLPYWSNPSVSLQGAAMGTAQTQNNARVLRETAPTVANFRTAGADAGLSAR